MKELLMPLMTWKEEYSVKVSLIDQQHTKLIELLNQMYDGLRAQKGKEVLGNVLDELVRYTDSHFQTEERLMQTHRYPGYETHKLEHHMLVTKVTGFQKAFHARSISVSLEVMMFLRDWLNGHILGTDKQYVSHFAQKGVH
jgi:hemerythrin